jgi:mono/diheme cytochrome c family protein
MSRASTALLIVLCAGALGCEDGSRGAAFDFERMIVQPRYDAFGSSTFFDDRRAMREPPELTVPLGAASRVASASAPPPTLALLARGRERFEIYCAPCHGVTGLSTTPVAERMALRPPPSLHEPRIRDMDAAYLHTVMMDGFGLMPSYAPMLPQTDAWGVAYYVKALQISMGTPLSALPPELQDRARGALGAPGTPTGDAQ